MAKAPVPHFSPEPDTVCDTKVHELMPKRYHVPASRELYDALYALWQSFPSVPGKIPESPGARALRHASVTLAYITIGSNPSEAFMCASCVFHT
jgi:hypothetical protein